MEDIYNTIYKTYAYVTVDLMIEYLFLREGVNHCFSDLDEKLDKKDVLIAISERIKKIIEEMD